jgi:hypothetical protein
MTVTGAGGPKGIVLAVAEGTGPAVAEGIGPAVAEGTGPAVAEDKAVELVPPQAVSISPTINKNTRVRSIRIIPSRLDEKSPVDQSEL